MLPPSLSWLERLAIQISNSSSPPGLLYHEKTQIGVQCCSDPFPVTLPPIQIPPPKSCRGENVLRFAAIMKYICLHLQVSDVFCVDHLISIGSFTPTLANKIANGDVSGHRKAQWECIQSPARGLLPTSSS